jgi:hypothetical protein
MRVVQQVATYGLRRGCSTKPAAGICMCLLHWNDACCKRWSTQGTGTARLASYAQGNLSSLNTSVLDTFGFTINTTGTTVLFFSGFYEASVAPYACSYPVAYTGHILRAACIVSATVPHAPILVWIASCVHYYSNNSRCNNFAQQILPTHYPT